MQEYNLNIQLLKKYYPIQVLGRKSNENINPIMSNPRRRKLVPRFLFQQTIVPLITLTEMPITIVIRIPTTPI
ncbi:UNKNOWN [Stylonychia lemnae]|uniref:Uncharacterized protein n=1 Tax=Stylonychia lemnae TaxID=5949 RepID=A0A077ZWK4_STYLE|nr:UNKNOWN [Stylonychia lemnae]|eukprot:CDW72841.1 UNKNOWN [Stylonychia lemnae]